MHHIKKSFSSVTNSLFFIIIYFSFTICLIFIADFKAYPQSENIQSLSALFEQLYQSKDDKVMSSINESLYSEIESNIDSYEDFKELSQIKGLFAILSPDQNVKLLTWGYKLSDGTNRYSGVINYFLKETGRKYTERLIHVPLDLSKYQNTVVSSENWYGAVYYHIIHRKFKGENFYLLLGYDGYDDFINIKLIDALVLNEDDYATFGAPVFNFENIIMYRIIFRYAERINMLLKYDTKLNIVYWDHLSPSKPDLIGKYEYYGPDLTFDALEFEKGIWKYIPDYIFKN